MENSIQEQNKAIALEASALSCSRMLPRFTPPSTWPGSTQQDR
jgi:hypothetical protein